MNLQQKIQLGLGSLLVLAGGASFFFMPIAGGPLIAAGIAVAGFSNTVTKAISNVVSKP